MSVPNLEQNEERQLQLAKGHIFASTIIDDAQVLLSADIKLPHRSGGN